MSVFKIKIKIRGQRPYPYANNEWEWRHCVATKAREYQLELVNFQINKKTKFNVIITFYFCNKNIPKGDLDNLAKPILDTLFLVYNPQVKDKTLTGALFNVDDSQICKLVLEKKCVSSFQNEGADIDIKIL